MNITEDMYEVLECGCWEWQGTTNPQGYATLKGKQVHRVWWSIRVGPIPAGWQVDHLCFNPACVNPDHHEAVPTSINNLRRKVRTRMLPWASHCVRGHELDDMNTIWRSNGTGRQCRLCRRMREQEWVLRNNGTAIKPIKPWTSNGTLKNKHLYEVTPQMLEDAQIDGKWLALFDTCNHSKGSSVGITEGRAKNVSADIDARLDKLELAA